MEGAISLGDMKELEGQIEFKGEQTIVIAEAVTIEGNKLRFSKDASIEDGRLAGVFIQRQTKSNLWNLGDWVLAMQERFGEEAAQYVSVEHFSEKHLKRSTWVCEKIEPSRRVAQLSFEHHAAVAGIADKRDQDRWLKRAADKNLSVKDLQRAMRQKKHRDRYVEQELPKGRFRILYMDPPWNFRDAGIITDSDAYNKAERHYPTLTVEQLKDLAPQIQEITARDSVLYLWVPVPLLPVGLDLMAEYGFEYKTECVWHKVSDKSGLGQNTAGHYSKLEHEVLLMGTHGKMPAPDMEVANRFPSVQTYPRVVDDQGDQIHSRKPEEFRQMIDTIWPTVTKTKHDRIDLFARTKIAGWDTWGNEIVEPVDGKAAAANDTPDAEPTGADVVASEEATKPRLVRPPRAPKEPPAVAASA